MGRTVHREINFSAPIRVVVKLMTARKGGQTA